MYPCPNAAPTYASGPILPTASWKHSRGEDGSEWMVTSGMWYGARRSSFPNYTRRGCCRIRKSITLGTIRSYAARTNSSRILRSIGRVWRKMGSSKKQLSMTSYYWRYNFYPQTFILPNEYVLFADEFKRHLSSLPDSRNIWIMKPTGKSQGKGIFLFNRLAQVSQWENHSA